MRERERESPVPCWANYSTSTPSMSAHRHTLEHGEHLLPLSSETRQTVQKRQRAAGEERNVFHSEMIAWKTSEFTHLVSVVEDVSPLSKFIQLVVYVAHCPSDTIGQKSERGPLVFFFFFSNGGVGKFNSRRITDSAPFFLQLEVFFIEQRPEVE